MRRLYSIAHASAPSLLGARAWPCNGMHRYNHQDHSMMSAMLTAENITSGSKRFAPWRVNQDAKYIEAGTHGEEQLIEAGGRAIPKVVGA